MSQVSGFKPEVSEKQGSSHQLPSTSSASRSKRAEILSLLHLITSCLLSGHISRPLWLTSGWVRPLTPSKLYLLEHRQNTTQQPLQYLLFSQTMLVANKTSDDFAADLLKSVQFLKIHQLLWFCVPAESPGVWGMVLWPYVLRSEDLKIIFISILSWGKYLKHSVI